MDCNINVLVVDDDVALRDAMAAYFKSGYTVFKASSGVEALKMLGKYPIDVVLTDVCMPGGSGVELVDQLRASGKEMPVIVFMTGYTTVTEEEAKLKGVACVIAKPFGGKRLMETIRQLVNEQLSRSSLAS